MSEKAPRIAVSVADVTQMTPRVKRFRLRSESGEPLPPFAGGAHITVEMRDGDVLRSNSYSLMSSPSLTSSYDIGVLREESGRGGSRFLHQAVVSGARLQISHPVNLFPIAQTARRHILVAGGIGITPLIAMADQLSRNHAAYELHYASRSRAEAACVDELVRQHSGRVLLYYSDRGERLSFEALLRFQPLGTHLYVCGPSRMIEAALDAAQALGWPPQNLHQERFAAPAVGAPYEVKLARSNRLVSVAARQSMLEAIEAAGVEVPHLCRGGACGQCETSVIAHDGELLHADHFLTDAEKKAGTKVMPCVSRFLGPSLVLDL